jgi:hypothetical protein
LPSGSTHACDTGTPLSPEIVADLPAPGCFPKAKSRDLNHLIMIHLYLARQTRGISIPSGVDEVPATGAAAE